MNLELQHGSRSRILAAFLIGLMSIFVLRLFYLQIIQHGLYTRLANAEQLKRLTIPAKRGLIYALDGKTPVPLVMNQTVYTVFADPKITTDDEKIIDAIRDIAGGNARPKLKELLDKKSSRYQILATRISRLQADKIKAKKLKGIGFQEQTQRVYPEGSLAAQTLGFVNYEGKPSYGIESGLNKRLSGKDGLLQSVTDVSDVPLTIGDRNIDRPAVDGDNIVLSIDRNIQSRLEQALVDGLKRTGATRASAIAVDPNSGRVLAMANLPSYDPSKFFDVKDAAAFNNNVISTPYEPGSDMKTLTMATGIDKGVVRPEDTYVNTDSIQVDDRVITNAYKGQTGTITFQHALNWSLNTGFVTVAERLGDGNNITRQARDTMYDYFYNKFRLGQFTDIEVAGEAKGTIIPPTEADGNAVRYSNMAFGQGLDATMIQVASAFCPIVNGGYYYKPTVVAGVMDKDGKYITDKIKAPTQIIKESTANQVKEMTHIARSTFFASVDKSGFYVGGKTGTSQVIKNGVYSDDETVGTYLGYGGNSDRSEYVIMVQVSGDHMQMQGAMHAMPIFTDISNWMLDYLSVKPKG